jgi:hypothetical protein
MFTKRLIIILLALVALATVTACSGFVRGSGDLITETRQVSNFDRISIEGSGEAIIMQSGNESLTIETDDNIMAHIKAEVEGGTLKLGIKERNFPINLVSPTRLVFTVGVDDFNGLSISGSGAIMAETLDTKRLEANISGSGKVKISNLAADQVNVEISGSGLVDLVGGEAAEQDISISGSGKYLAGGLCSPLINLSVSGSGEATVCAVDTLDADLSGSGNVNYYGQPSVSITSSGSGNIRNLGEN